MEKIITEKGIIMPETELEYKIISSDVFRESCKFSKSKGEGHPEKNTGEHVAQILGFIDSQNWDNYRQDLRLLGLLHDIGKFKTEYNDKRNLITRGHSFYSEEIARDFISDENLLKSIKIHDKYFHFFKDSQRDRLREDKFIKTYSDVDLDTLIRFNYADSNNRERNSVMWFEDKLYDLNIRQNKVYLEDLR